MTQGVNPWVMFQQIARVPTPDQINKADQTKSQWSVSAQGSYSPEDVFFDTQDRHHHSGQINVKFPQHWEPMLQEFIAKNPRFRSLQDLVRTAIVHQMVYEAMREQLLGQAGTVQAPILISEVIDNATAALNAQYDAWERRIKTFEAMCQRMEKAGDVDGLATELNKYDGDINETDMIPHYHQQFLRIVGKYNGILNVMISERKNAA